MRSQTTALVPVVQPGPPLAWWRPRPPKTPAAKPGAPSEKPRAQVAFYGLVAFTFVLLVAPQEQFPALGFLHLAVLSSCTAAAALIYDRTRRGKRILPKGTAASLAIALAVWTCFTIPFSMWPGGSINLLTSIYLKSIIIFLLLGAVIDSSTRLRQLELALTLFALPLAITAILHFAEHDVVAGEQAVDRIVGYQAALAKNPNDLALLLNLILPLTASLFLAARKTLPRILFAAAIALDAAAIVATFSRAGFLTLGAVLLGFTWKLRGRPERIFVWAGWALALVGVLLLLPAGYLSHLDTITNISADATGSAQERSRDMLAALGQIAQRPIFGAGLGMNVLALNADRGSTWRMVHNVYLQYAADLGIPGLLLFLALFWSCFSGVRAAVRKLRQDPSQAELFNLAEGVQLSLIAFALAAFFHPIGYHFPFFYIAGLGVAVRGIALGKTQ